jgi:hypothetical protein
MKALSPIELLVLNATSDDFEDLEHIYQSISLEFSAENFKPNDQKSFYWREALNAPLLREIADTIKKLTSEGLLEAKTESGVVPDSRLDSAIVWQAWFHATEEAIAILRAQSQRPPAKPEN